MSKFIISRDVANNESGDHASNGLWPSCRCVLQIVSEERMTGMGSVAIGTLIFVREADMKMAASGRYALIVLDVFTARILLAFPAAPCWTCLAASYVDL